ncbi:MAG TPA: hypothetical protein VMC79_07730 [Rectinemataceae bacterium]|nr:hypothetical protein [Rectinemataceae bacterium]
MKRMSLRGQSGSSGDSPSDAVLNGYLSAFRSSAEAAYPGPTPLPNSGSYGGRRSGRFLLGAAAAAIVLGVSAAWLAGRVSDFAGALGGILGLFI